MSKVDIRKFERIPIVKYEEDCRYAGRVAYKSFIPRSSDNYFRLLKDVDFENLKSKKEIKGDFEFNSQF